MKRIILDCDGVLADTRRHVATLMGVPYDPCAPAPYSVTEWFGERGTDARKILALPDFWWTLPVMEGALEGVENLRARNCEVYVSTKPYESCPGWGEIRRGWLAAKFNFEMDDVMIGGAKYLIGGDVFVDDRVDMVERYEAENPNSLAILFNAPHNLTHHRTHRADWSSIWRFI